MKPLSILVLALALSGCATQAVTPVSGGDFDREQPVILFVTAPGATVVPQQVIGDEQPHLVLDGLS